MGQFSDDGQWWWNGTAWIATPQVVIPDLAIPQSESLQQSMRERWGAGQAGNAAQAAALGTGANALGFLGGLNFLSVERGSFRELRQWTIDQLAAATTYLLGPEEPMVAAETSLFREPAALGFFYSTAFRRDLGVVVTASHVLLLGFDKFDGQPRSVVLAANARDVRLERVRFGWLGLIVRSATQTWSIRGTVGVTQPEPVIQAWKAAASAPQKL